LNSWASSEDLFCLAIKGLNLGVHRRTRIVFT
jgi:hypothetical protein